MSVQRLLEFFGKYDISVVTNADIRDQIIESHSIVDKLYFYPFNESPDVILGMLVKWEETILYSPPISCAAVCYNENVEPWMQALICCKEMVHLFDSPEAVTGTKLEVYNLIENLLSKTGSFNLANTTHIQSFFDEYALFQAIALRFTIEGINRNRRKLNSESVDIVEIAREYDVSEVFAAFLMSDRWLSTRRRIARD